MTRPRWRDSGGGPGFGARTACQVCGYTDQPPESPAAAMTWRPRVALIPPAHYLCGDCARAAAALLPRGEALEISKCACGQFGLVRLADRHACSACVTAAIDLLATV